MRRFKNILLYANETASSDAALRRAEALAARNEALLSVVDVLPGSSGTRLTARLRELGILVAPAWRRGVAVRVGVLTGRPFVEIIRAVLRNGHDLVVLDAEAEDCSPGHPRGSTALHLLRDCPCPIWVVKRAKHGPHRRVVAALDAHEDWSKQQQESLRVLELAASVARSDGGELRVAYCLSHWTPGYSPRRLQNTLGRHRQRLDGLLARCDLSHVRRDVRLEREAAVDVIATLCEEADVLVMGTVWRSGPAGVLITDTASDALARVDCSVLAVKPEGFITPVRFSGRSARSHGVTRWAA